MSKNKKSVMQELDDIIAGRRGAREVNHALVESYYWDDLATAIRQYIDHPKDPYYAYRFLFNHPMCQRFFNTFRDSAFLECLDIGYIKVNPVTHRVEQDKSLNTKTAVWVELGPWIHDGEHIPQGGIRSHDPRLDCRASTFDKALVKLARKVWKHYRAQAVAIEDQERVEEPA